jgi:hypothetical protein
MSTPQKVAIETGRVQSSRCSLSSPACRLLGRRLLSFGNHLCSGFVTKLSRGIKFFSRSLQSVRAPSFYPHKGQLQCFSSHDLGSSRSFKQSIRSPLSLSLPPPLGDRASFSSRRPHCLVLSETALPFLPETALHSLLRDRTSGSRSALRN